MEHEIRVDDDVYRALVRNRQGFEQPNDVLRRLLLGGESPRGAVDDRAERGPRIGRLSALVDAGLIDIGDQLRHERVRKGQVLVGEVVEGGSIRTVNGVYSAPSPALKSLVGTDIDGWHNWVHVRSGKSLRELRASL
ncbi:restriction system modified-DNA reader domain-containing protein [Nocardia sp. NPDC055053]